MNMISCQFSNISDESLTTWLRLASYSPTSCLILLRYSDLGVLLDDLITQFDSEKDKSKIQTVLSHHILLLCIM